MKKSRLKVRSVSFRGTIQIAPYQFLQLEMTADATPKNAHEVLEALKLFVAEELALAKVGDDTERIQSFNDMVRDKRLELQLEISNG